MNRCKLEEEKRERGGLLGVSSRPWDADGPEPPPSAHLLWGQAVLSRGLSLVTWGSKGSCHLRGDLCGTLLLSVRLGAGYGKGGLAAGPQGSTRPSGLV